jgi:hypothetical protein
MEYNIKKALEEIQAEEIITKSFFTSIKNVYKPSELLHMKKEIMKKLKMSLEEINNLPFHKFEHYYNKLRQAKT